MALDILILGFVVVSLWRGYASGLMRGFYSLVLPVIGLMIVLKNCSVIAVAFNRLLHNYPAASFIALLLLLGSTWLGLGLVRNLLLKLVDWSRLSNLDAFLGGVFGLTKGLALAWAALALILILLPSSVRVIQSSAAAVRILALAERVADAQTMAGLASQAAGGKIAPLPRF